MRRCVGGLVVLLVMYAIAAVINHYVQLALFGPMVFAGPNLKRIVLAMLVSTAVSLVLQSFIQAGQHLFFFRIARRDDANVNDLFCGGPESTGERRCQVRHVLEMIDQRLPCVRITIRKRMSVDRCCCTQMRFRKQM